ncbi:MAG: SO_0444 family Cu/Zn efflux transporter [Gammaproteobacteria bacterium]|nr:SO_0444 family Cu/Zn efflux transporter [Gammaproteobacteria bacterium]
MSIYFQHLLALSLEAAPWLVMGLFLGGLIKGLLPSSFLERHLSKDDFPAILKAALLGAPLPLCSCGVIPAALGLRKAGASKPATASFLVSTPETGVDSVAITWAMMGPFMAFVRPVTAVFSAITAGLLVAKFDRTEKTPATPPFIDSTPSSCCSTSSCCDASAKQPGQPGLPARAVSGVHYAFTKLYDDIILWLAVGMLFAAAVQTFLPADFLAQWGQGFAAMLVMVLAGIPMYICATASTPVAAGLMLAGVSPGVALVLLLTGPATNISTLGIIRQEMGTRTMWLYLLAVISSALCAGLIVNAIVYRFAIDIPAQLQHSHSDLLWLNALSLIFLALLAIRRWLPLRFVDHGHQVH